MLVHVTYARTYKMRTDTQGFQTFPFTYLIKDAKNSRTFGFIICVPKLMRSPYETKIILLLKATALAGALAARHECPGARPFPSAPTQRLFLSLATHKVLIGGLPAGERDLTGVVIRRQQVLLAGSVHPVHVLMTGKLRA